MQIYHTETQEDYDALLDILSWKGYDQVVYYRVCGNYYLYGDDTHIVVDDSSELPMKLINGVYAGKRYPDIPIQKYKAKDKFNVADSFKLNNDVADTIKKVTKDNHELYRKLIVDLERTYIAKNKDYGNSFEQSLDKRGRIAGLVRIEDKLNRADNLAKSSEINVVDESEIDTYLDMANYCIMQAMWLVKQED